MGEERVERVARAISLGYDNREPNDKDREVARAAIAALEAAEEGSRKLDEEISVAVDGLKYGVGIGTARPYTTSLDAALTLVPEGWYTIHAAQHPIKGTWFWSLGVNAGPGRQFAENVESNHRVVSPALALCTAALRARQHEG